MLYWRHFFFVSNGHSKKFELIQKSHVPTALRFSCQGPAGQEKRKGLWGREWQLRRLVLLRACVACLLVRPLNSKRPVILSLKAFKFSSRAGTDPVSFVASFKEDRDSWRNCLLEIKAGYEIADGKRNAP